MTGLVEAPEPAAHSGSPEEAATNLSVDVSTGLSTAAAEERQLKYGPNALPESKGRTLLLS